MLTILAFLAAAAASPGVTKPKPMTIPTLTTAMCLDEDAAAKIGEELDGPLGPGDDDYNEQWQQYISARLAKLGLSEPEQNALLQRVTTSKKYTDLDAKNQKILASVGKEMEALDEAEDEAEECRIMVRAFARMKPLALNTQKQWELVDAEIVAEAKRRKIKLD
ncbi:hypothetical protein [Novosphingobium sp.]|uniref:hypothetical protein n=1 Tax=Novosphingobium sp. TaxID=1874826 RepID=UPI00286C0476|nr:hypothetical protein [Novosphingobium sp.]